MSWGLKFTGTEDGIKILGLSGLVSYAITLSHDMGGSGGGNYGRYFFDGRNDGDGYSGYIYNQGASNVSEIQINGIPSTHVDVFNAVAGDVISFQANTSITGSSVTIGAKGSGGNSLAFAGISKIEIIDSLETRILDATASDHSNTGVQPELFDTIAGNNATGVGFPTDGSAWIDLGGSSTNYVVTSSPGEQLEQGQINTVAANFKVDSLIAEQLENAGSVSLSNNLSVMNSPGEQLEQGNTNTITASFKVDSVIIEQLEQGHTDLVVNHLSITSITAEQIENALKIRLPDSLSITSLIGEQLEQGHTDPVANHLSITSITAEQLENALKVTLSSESFILTAKGQQQEEVRELNQNFENERLFIFNEQNILLINTTSNITFIKNTPNYTIKKV